MTPNDPRHGTNAGYLVHQRGGEKACADCLTARARYQRHRTYDKQLGRPRIVPSLGTQRRIHALQRLGWSLTVIAKEGGWQHAEDLYYALRHDTCNRRTAERIAKVYDRLSMKLPPYTSGSVRAQKRAERLGYLPPLAWDDIDDPTERPRKGSDHKTRDEVDEAVVIRVLSGELLTCTKAEKDEVMRRWTASGKPAKQLAERMGWKDDRYGRGAA